MKEDLFHRGYVITDCLKRYGMAVDDVFTRQVQRLSLEDLEPGRCPFSGEKLQSNIITPGGESLNFVSESTYYSIISRFQKNDCALCNIEQVPDWKIECQKSKPWRFWLHFCPECWDYLAIVACVVLDILEVTNVMSFKKQVNHIKKKEKSLCIILMMKEHLS